MNEVRRGIGHDNRIGFAFLFPGVGYGGSCFPKDVQALAAVARQAGVTPRILTATHEVNLHQRELLAEKVRRHFGGSLDGLKLAVWGLAFKPGTDDIREAPSLSIIERLLQWGAEVAVHDPVATANVRAVLGPKLRYCEQPYEALHGADALVIVTEWKQFVHPDFGRMRQLMRQAVIFDGRNLYHPQRVAQEGFVYYSVGRPVVQPG